MNDILETRAAMSEALPTLHALGLKHGTDKASVHDYLNFYERWFQKWRHEPVNLLEMGTLGGNSMRCWNEYFTHTDSKIVGIELERDYWKPDTSMPRLMLWHGRQEDEILCGNIKEQFDIIIDDAGHFGEQQWKALHLWLPKVKPGGIYIIEDLHAAYWPEYNGNGAHRIMSHLFGLVHDINCGGNSKVGNRDDCMSDGWRSLIRCITFHKSVCVIERA